MLGIYTCYFLYGFLQEELISVEHIDASVPLLAQYVIGFIISFATTVVIQMKSGQWTKLTSLTELRIGFLNNLSMITSNYALEYIDYPTQALVKSAKILPVMAFGIVRKTYDYSLYKYICAGFITVGLVIFNIAKLGSSVAGMTFSTFGIILLFMSLFFDGLNGTQADKDKNKNGGGMFSLMLANNIMGIILVVFIMILTYANTGEILIYQLNMNNFLSILLISFAGAIGQVLIYLTIVRFDCFILSIVNTSRKFVSILFSVIWFNHPLTLLHWIGVSIVIGAITADVIISHLEKQKKKSIIKKKE